MDPGQLGNIQTSENNDRSCCETLLAQTGKICIIQESAPKNDSSAINSEARKRSKVWEKLSQPWGEENHATLRLFSSFLCLVVLWTLLFTLLNKELLPGGKLLILIVLISISYIVGDVFKSIGLPKVLGMLISGMAMRNFGYFFDTKNQDVYSSVVSVTRQVALTCILTTAGLELDAKTVMQQSLIVLELSFIPCIFEAIGVAFFSKLILNLQWTWGMLIGFMMGAVSPAIVVPALLKVQKKGYDADKKISTIVIAAASFDDIVAISGFGIFFGMIFNEGDIVAKLLHAPIEMIIGISVGVVWGFVVAWVPHPVDHHVIAKRVFMVGAGGVMFVLGSQLIAYDGAGPLACIVAAFVGCMFWKWQGWSVKHNPVRDVFGSMWILLQPALFGLIGAEIDLSVIRLSSIIQGVIIICGGLVARAIACSAVLLTADITWKELIFINVAWVPKATVQAALGSLALGRAKMNFPMVENDIANGQTALMIAVLSILLTAPLGAIGINMLASQLLEKTKISQPAMTQMA